MKNTINEHESELLLRVVRHIQQYWQKKLDGYPYLKPRDIDAITHIHHSSSPVTMKDLSSHLRVSPAAITQMVRNMERYGLLKKESCREDHRIHYLKLHPKLINTINEENMYFLEMLKQFKRYSSDEFDLEHFLEILVEFIECQESAKYKKRKS